MSACSNKLIETYVVSLTFSRILPKLFNPLNWPVHTMLDRKGQDDPQNINQVFSTNLYEYVL